MWVNRSFRSPKMSDHERIAHLAHQKWATMSESLNSLTKINEWVNRSLFWANRSCAHFFAKNERFARKSDERIPSPENVRNILFKNTHTHIIVQYNALYDLMYKNYMQKMQLEFYFLFTLWGKNTEQIRIYLLFDLWLLWHTVEW